MTLQNTAFQNYFLLTLLGAVVLLVVLIFLPFLSSLVLATAFAIMLRPVYLWLMKTLKFDNFFAALITMLLVLVVVIVPFSIFATKMVSQAKNLYENIASNEALPNFANSVTQFIEKTFGIQIQDDQEHIFNLQEYAQPVATWIFQHLGSLVKNIAQFGMNSIIAILAFFFLLKDGHRFKKSLIDISPLSEEQDKKILDNMKNAVNSVIRGALVLAIVQGIIAGVGYTIFGVSNPVLWGGITAVSALVPGIGTGLVILPVILYMILTGFATGPIIGMIIWGLFAVGLIDNFIGPKLYGRGIKVHTILILISVLGGIRMFGPLGFIMGPLVLSLMFALIDLIPIILGETSETTTTSTT